MQKSIPVVQLLLPVLWLLAAVPCRAETLDLEQAVALALEHAPAVRAAEAGRDMAEQEGNIGLAGLLPHVDASGTYQLLKQKTRYDEPQAIFRPDLKYRDSTVKVRAVQPLFDLERWAGYRQGEISAESGEMKLRIERQRLMLETAQTALEMVSAKAAVQAAKAKEGAAEALAGQAKAAFEAGVAAVNERLDAESRRDLARAERLAAENSYDQAREKLASLTGVQVEAVSPPHIAGKLVSPVPDTPEAWEAQAATQALPVRLSQLQWQAAQQEDTRAWGSNLPKVEAFAELQGNRATSGQLGGTRSRNQAVGVQVTLPLFSGGSGVAAVKKGQKARVQAEYALQDDVRLARLSARQSFRGYLAAVAELAAMRQAVVTAREAAEAASMGHEVGLRSVSEVLDAVERRFTAEKNLAEAEAGLVFAELQLHASVGALDESPLPGKFGESLSLR